MSDDLELSRALTAVVAAVPGVGDLYASGPLVKAVSLALINAVSDDETDDAKVAVSRDASGRLVVMATFSVENGYAARVVLSAVNDALRAHLATSILATREPAALPAAIEVKVSRIETEIVTATATATA